MTNYILMYVKKSGKAGICLIDGQKRKITQSEVEINELKALLSKGHPEAAYRILSWEDV